MNTEQSIFDPDDSRRLNYTQQLREAFIQQLAKDNKLPDSEEDRTTLLKLLDGMDRTSISKTKIKTDSDANKTRENNTVIMANLLRNIKNTQAALPPTTRGGMELTGEFTEITIVPGEMDQGVQQLTYDEFYTDGD